MKKIFTFLMASFLILFMGEVFSQAPNKLSFQAVVRNSSNYLVVSSPIGVRVSILQGSSSNSPLYVETHTPSTNANGLITLEIGGGKVVSGDFKTFAWGSGDAFIKLETDPSGGTNYTIVSTTQILSVPYALYANKSGDTDSLNTKIKKLDSLVTAINSASKNLGLVFYSVMGDKYGEFWKANYDGSSQTKISIKSLPTNAEIDTNSFRVSPDGKKLFFLLYTLSNTTQSLYSCNIDGTGLAKLIDNVDEIHQVR